MAIKIKFKRGLKINLPTLDIAEPALVTDEKRIYIGSSIGNIPLPTKEDIDDINIRIDNIDVGVDGTDGVDGTNGTNGIGVVIGGTTGQILAKKSNTNYDTEWVNKPSVGVTSSEITTIKVLTQVQYDALPISKLTDNTLYVIRG